MALIENDRVLAVEKFISADIKMSFLGNYFKLKGCNDELIKRGLPF